MRSFRLFRRFPGWRRWRSLWTAFRDPAVPLLPKLAVVVSLVYLISPLDLLPELMLPGLGLVDDALLVAGALNYLSLYAAGREKDTSGPDHTGKVIIDV